MPNYDGRNEMRFTYATNLNSRVFTHRMTIDFDPEVGDGATLPVNFATVDLVTPGAIELTLSDMVTDLLDLLLPFYRTTTEWLFAEWWRYPAEPSQDAVFYGVQTINAPGTAPSGADLEAQQCTITYRTAGGGIMRQQLMESIVAGNAVQTFPTTLTIANSLATYMVGTGHLWVGRDNTRPIASYRLGSGQNERLARKRFRE